MPAPDPMILGDTGQVPPSGEAEILHQAQAAGVSVDDDCEGYFVVKQAAGGDGMCQ